MKKTAFVTAIGGGLALALSACAPAAEDASEGDAMEAETTEASDAMEGDTAGEGDDAIVDEREPETGEEGDDGDRTTPEGREMGE